MATTTTNFGWDIPQSTDLVKDGATAIAALGQDIDTAFIDLKGGTTGQVLSKASGTDLDFSWIAADDTNAIQNAIVDAKGDLIAATANDTPARLAVGTNGQILTADSAEATGMKWASPATAGGMTLISTTNLTVGSTVTIGSIPTTYKNLFLVIRNSRTLINAGVRFRFNSDSTASRHALIQGFNAGNTAFSSTSIDMLQNGANPTTNSGMITCMVPDYANTVTWKQVEINAFVSSSTSSNYNWDRTFGFYNQTAAITSIDLTTTSTFVAGTALLYGVA